MARDPTAPAIAFEGETISYRDLDARANQIGVALIRGGLAPRQPVAILLSDGPRQIAALLGVLKAGGVLVCLDVTSPTKRLRHIVAETTPALLIADGPSLDRHAALVEALAPASRGVLLFDPGEMQYRREPAAGGYHDGAEVERLPAAHPGTRVLPADPLYIVYTSGSTGEPKGIVQSHASFCQYIEWQSRRFDIRPPHRFAQWASIAYDAGYRQIFGTLCFGATLCMAPSRVRYDAHALYDWVRGERVTILNLVPSFCREFIEVLAARPEASNGTLLPHLERLLLTGERVSVELALAWQRLFAEAPELFNLYGPSECILATCHRVGRLDGEEASIPIGREIDGREILILDEEQSPCPPGTQGEMYIRSRYLTMGYFKRPEETGTRFIQNPLHDDYADAVYRTGDLGRRLDDGGIEFRGRLDNQVKLRGVRVEPGEIEAALERHDGIESCAVVVSVQPRREKLIAKERTSRRSGDPEGRQVLVAYYTAKREIPSEALHAFLAESLPAPMIPQRFIRLERLPLNSNRKLDRRLLARSDLARRRSSAPYVAPRNAVEEAMANIWRDVLGVERVGVDDGFFELGGDSLLAMRVLSGIRRTLDVSLSFLDLFESRTVAGLAERARTSRAEHGQLAPSPRADSRRAPYPLTLAQQGVWFLWRLEPDSPYYIGQGTIHLRGAVDPDALRSAWRSVLLRHEILRVRFGFENGGPIQTFEEDRALDLPLTDLSDRPGEEQWITLEAEARKRARRALDLERDPLFQGHLFKLSGREYRLLVTFHEIVIDLWGLSILLEDLGALYRAVVTGQPPCPPALDYQFGDYALWESSDGRQRELRDHGAYWREELAGELPVLDLPADRPRPVSPGFRGRARSVTLDADLSGRLGELGVRENATLFMTLLSAFDVLLYVYSGQKELIVGAPIANRGQGGAESLVGFFLNMLPLRARIEPVRTFLELLGETRRKVTGAISHAGYPFMWMLEGADIVRDVSVTPVFQVMFNMLNLPQVSSRPGDLELVYDELETGYIKYDLCLYAQEHEGEIFLQLAYQTDLFDETTIDRMLKNFVILLESIAGDPGKTISELRVLDDEEWRTLVHAHNETRRDFGIDRCIHDLFTEQAERTPRSVALIHDGRSITYADLESRSNRLAHYLCRHGVGAGTVVAICIERSFDMVAGLLAIMKAGGTYVALDPDFPLPRLLDIIEDASPAVLLLQETLDRFPGFAGAKVFVDAERELIGREPAAPPTSGTTPEDLLNIVYTSSTTGRPKGVLLTNGSVLNRLHWMWRAHPFRPGDVAVLQKSCALVAATWECFGALLRGVPTVVLKTEQVRDPAELWRELVGHGVTHLLASPGILEGVLQQAESRPGEWRTARLATTSAEPIPPAMVKRWRTAFPGVPLLNLYGATECASNVTEYDTTLLPEDSRRVPIGTPIDNVQVYVLDDQLNPSPIGVTGELCVSGACLARGYLNDPELTARQFVQNPFAAGREARLYRTGDLARLRDDGCIELVGRKDDQVKIRGFRVELNDVEAALSRLDGVERCAVTLHGDGDRARLVAYIVAGGRLSRAEVRSFLRERLPDYMVPSDCVFLDSLPLNSSGKVDRRALPEPGHERPQMEAGYVAPRTTIEESLSRIWSEVLAVERVGVHDDFFELGGHSLQAVQLASRTSEATGRDVTVRTLFSRSTVAALASALDGLPRHALPPREAAEAIHGVVSAAPSGRASSEPLPPCMTVERRPLLSLFAIGEIPPVDSASVGCMPVQLLDYPGFTRDEVIYEWCGDVPTLIAVTSTSLGRIARLKLPLFNSELYRDQRQLVRSVIEALKLAAALGARTVSLTGLIPSATDYGRAVLEEIGDRRDLPRISTGHGTTVSSVVMSVDRIAGESGRSLAREHVGVLGLGSIGRVFVRLMLRCLPHPASITLCDVFSKLPLLGEIREEIIDEARFRGPVRIVESASAVPPAFYDATLIVGATNVPDILDVNRLRPGTMIVDDSSPHCFEADRAIERLRERRDILFTEGGVVESREPIEQLSYLPRGVKEMMNLAHMAPFSTYNPFQITSCVLSGLLSSLFEDLEPTVGFVSVDACLRHFNQLHELGFRAAELHCGGFALPPESIRDFRARFGARA